MAARRIPRRKIVRAKPSSRARAKLFFLFMFSQYQVKRRLATEMRLDRRGDAKSAINVISCRCVPVAFCLLFHLSRGEFPVVVRRGKIAHQTAGATPVY